jgi:methyl-accepting chemotaxis protein
MKVSLGVKIATPVVVLGLFIIVLPIFNHWQFEKVSRSLESGAIQEQMRAWGMAGGLSVSRRIVKDLRPAIATLQEMAGFIGKQGRTFASSSEEIAHGAADQAASLEETSATLE